ncbi:DUF6456 domain-containing protein [Paracoccus aerodenitrificans]|uniref:DUF6456 domain-containing protein n=1 Tax=Paracoccus aerodenitrificans TaxID=3017781 RepID=UPI0022F0E05E|nr:DUF6456 domain-containing protein [Paracoccus aerodenitrificans]WBU65509.1 DUF6456 domain-containing protein [Paracoccus aerodenitrificans]
MTVMKPDFAIAQAVPQRGEPAPQDRPHAGQAPSGSDHLSEDARLYLLHVEEGESIRAIARAEGCHPSTILRRIRRFEAKREDPLVDEALQKLGFGKLPGRGDSRKGDETRRYLRRLAEPGAELIVAPDMKNAIISRGDIRTAVIDRKLAEEFALNGWVEPVTSGKRMLRYRLSADGRAELRRRKSGDGGLPRADAFRDARPVIAHMGMAEASAGFGHGEKHRVMGMRDLPDPETGEHRRMRVNLGESPLLLLARRRDSKGNAFLSPELVAAGERLREDFEAAQMGPRVTQNWDRFMTAGIDGTMTCDGLGGGPERARNRVAEALRELGPGMGDLVLRVCCFLEGIEMTEQRLGWSARSGKVVLKLALERLARHYEKRYGAGGPLIG